MSFKSMVCSLARGSRGELYCTSSPRAAGFADCGCSMQSCVYSVALDDSARPSRPLSNTTTVCHALLLDGRTCVCFEILRGGRRARVFSGAARAAAGEGRTTQSCCRRLSSRR